MLKNYGATFALLALLSLAGIAGYKSFSPQPACHPGNQTHAECPDKKPAHDDPLSKFINWSTHDPVAFFTFVLAIFTGALVVVSGIQIGYLRRADETARRSADAALLAAQAAKAQADQMGLQTDLIEKEHGVSRHQFFATNRPRLIVHFVRRVLEYPDLPSDEQTIAAEFRIMNVGTSDAWITGSCVALDRFIPGEWPYPDELIGRDVIDRDWENRRRFAVGATDRVIVRSTVEEGLIERLGIDPEEQDLIQRMDDLRVVTTRSRLYLIGFIVYEDTLENSLTLYFCREFSRETNRFTPARDCDWEEAYD
jgi:hypothetical protein